MGATPPPTPGVSRQNVQLNTKYIPRPYFISTAWAKISYRNMGTRVLSHRALQELASSLAFTHTLLTVPRLMKRNHKNSISIKVDDEVLFRVPRPLAMFFSAVWSRMLQDITCTIATVDFPLDPPAASNPPATPLVSQSGSNSGKEPASPGLLPPPPPPPSGKFALKFIIQWMEAGGAEPKGIQAVPYPRGYRPGLEKILAIASKLEISELVTRVKCDLGKMRAPKPKKCPACKKSE